MSTKMRRARYYMLSRAGVSAVAPTITSAAPTAPAYGVAYTHTYTATGSPAPTWSVTAGALPDGLSLHATTGVLSGTPTASGNFSWTVTATNVAGTADQAATVEVLPGFTVTTTGAATLTIASLTVSASTTVYWGDGNSDAYTGAGTRTHDYAGAGTWKVYFSSATTVTELMLSDNKITLNSAGIKSMVNLVTAYFLGFKAGTFNSSDVSAWRPTNFYLFSMPAGYAGTFNSSDVSAWRPTSFYLHSMPAGYAGTFDSSDVSAWRPTSFHLYSMRAGYAGTFDSSDVSAWRPTTFNLFSMPAGYTFALTAGGLTGWVSTTTFTMSGNGLSQAQVDQILADFYTGFATRTGTNGFIGLGGTNAAPSGTLQAACPPTTGKEAAYELVNDSCGVSLKHWATVTITA